MGGSYCNAMAVVWLHNGQHDTDMMDGRHVVTTIELQKREYGLGIYILKLLILRVHDGTLDAINLFAYWNYFRGLHFNESLSYW